ncbi:metalloregulator ArsR/SmtB family transcription factor [Mycoplasmatota bacterium WC30]
MDQSKLFKVFSDNNRINIMKNLVMGDCCSCQFADKFTISQPTLTYHLKMIKDSGLATIEKAGTWRKYHVNFKAIDEMIAFLQELKKYEGDTCEC